MYVIYNKETTKILLAPARSVGCYVEHYRTASAAKAALTRLDKKGKLGKDLVKEDFAIDELFHFREHTEKKVTRRNALTGEKFEESINANYATSPASENYWQS